VLKDCYLFSLPQITDTRGSVTFMEGQRHIPFDIKRVYYLYGMQENTQRGAHAHKKLKQVLIALSGRFTVKLDDGKEIKEYTLSHPSEGLYVAPGVWRELQDFSSHAICLALTSELYDEEDYFRDYAAYRASLEKR